MHLHDTGADEPKTTAFDAICDALSLDYEATGVRHYVSSREGNPVWQKRSSQTAFTAYEYDLSGDNIGYFPSPVRNSTVSGS